MKQRTRSSVNVHIKHSYSSCWPQQNSADIVWSRIVRSWSNRRWQISSPCPKRSHATTESL